MTWSSCRGVSTRRCAWPWPAARRNRPPLALTFDYGQRHRAELDRAAGVAGHFRSEHLVVTLDTSAWGGSALTDPSIDVPTAGGGDGIPVTYVPARNSIFLAVALGVAEARGLDAVWIGVNAIDYSGLPRLPPRVHRGVPGGGRHRPEAGRRRPARSASARR